MLGYVVGRFVGNGVGLAVGVDVGAGNGIRDGAGVGMGVGDGDAEGGGVGAGVGTMCSHAQRGLPQSHGASTQEALRSKTGYAAAAHSSSTEFQSFGSPGPQAR